MSAARSIPAEARLLYRLAGPDGSHTPTSEYSGTSLRWKRLFRLAGQERATSILHHYMKASGAGLIPAAEAARLQRLAMLAEFRMRYLDQRLHEALEHFARAEIRIMLLKGAGLAAAIGVPFYREMVDLDLLVPCDRVPEAWSLLLGLEWRRALDERYDAFYEEHHHLCPLEDARGSGLCLEIHSALFPNDKPFALSTGEVWEEAREVTVGRWPALVPSDSHMALHLCTHFAWSHQMGSGAWRTFLDLSILHANNRLKWGELVSLACRTRAKTCCYWTLRLARRMAGLPVPDAVLAEFAPPLPERMLKALERYFLLALCPPADWEERTLRLGNLFWELAIRPAWSGHGGIRPWGRSKDFIAIDDLESTRQPPPGVALPEQRVARMKQLLREIRAIL